MNLAGLSLRQRVALAAVVLALVGMQAASAPSVAADGFHDHTFRFGQRAMAMGGAVVGSVDEPTASYYNPAGLSWLRGALFSGAVQFYGTDERKVVGGLRAQDFEPKDLHSESFLALPSSSVITHSIGKGRHRIAYSTFLLSDVDDNFGGTFKADWLADNGDQIDMVLHGGRRLKDRIVLIGPSWSWRATDTLAVGLSAFYARRDQTVDTWSDYQEDYTDPKTGAPVKSIFYDDRVSTTMADGTVFARLGVMWRPSETWSMGLTLDSTSVQIHGDASVYAKYSQSGDPAAIDPQDQQPQRGTESYDGYDANTVHAWSGAAGFAWRPDPALMISTSAWLAAPVSYSRTSFAEAEANELQVVSVVERQLNWNAAAGVEWLVTPHWPLRVGFFTNRSASAELPETSPVPLPPHVDLYGVTFSAGYKDGGRAANIGAELQWGSGFDMVAKGVDQDAGNRGWVRAGREEFRFVFFMSGAMALAKKEAKGYIMQKIKDIKGKGKGKVPAPDKAVAPVAGDSPQ